MAFPSNAGPLEKTWYYVFRIICGVILFFLMAPIVVLIPLSFNAEPYFTFTQGMLSFDADAFSIRWYQDFINNPQWIHSIKNSVIIGVFATILATSFGTLARCRDHRRAPTHRPQLPGPPAPPPAHRTTAAAPSSPTAALQCRATL